MLGKLIKFNCLVNCMGVICGLQIYFVCLFICLFVCYLYVFYFSSILSDDYKSVLKQNLEDTGFPSST